jgi:gamma-glutamylcyclotransferase (GGCT)/AIG2-like uncharacterized protein YtfP
MNTPVRAIAKTPLVAVYGTLKRGLRNHHWLQGADFVGEDTLTTATLYDLGPFPGAKRQPSRGVRVEVFRVTAPQMAGLDQLEGYDAADPSSGLYDRSIVATAYGPAWLYLYNPDVDGCPVIRQGGWPLRRDLRSR